MNIAPNWAMAVEDAVSEIGRTRFSPNWSMATADLDEVEEAYSILLRDLAAGAREATACWARVGKFYRVSAGRWFADGALQFLKSAKIEMPIPGRKTTHWLNCKLFIRKELSTEAAATDGDKVHQADTAARRRGQRPVLREKVEAEMMKMDRASLSAMKEIELEATFNASRTTCRDARKNVLSGNVG